MSENEVGKSWYTKYRPRNMDEYAGDRVKNIIKKRFKLKENMPHVVMLHGNRGCGKTTAARLLSKYYLCENPQEDGTPCEECEMCQSINDILISGNSSEVECPGVVELDATIMNGKEAIQEVLDDALQAPIYSEYKVLIIDEVHMVSNAGQNSMLKIIEDIPKHLIIIFATTDPQKVLQTIKSRCQLTIEVRKQTVKDMAARLMTIAQKEKLTTSAEALEIVARQGDRVPRECINLLENIAKTYDNEVTVDNIRDYLGGTSSEQYLNFFKAANSSLEDILTFNAKLKEQDVKLREFVSGLMGFALSSMYIKHGISLEDYPTDYIKSVKEMFNMYTSSDFDMLLQILEQLYMQTADDNDLKNEAMLVLTAMRIGKINILANGLLDEQAQAIKENRISLIEHAKRFKPDNIEAIKKLGEDVDIQYMKDNFKDVTQVEDTAGLFDDIVVPELKPVEQIEKKEDNLVDIGKGVDSFFN